MFNVYSYSNPIKQKLWKNYSYFNNHDVSSLFSKYYRARDNSRCCRWNEDFSTLVTALKAAGLVGALQAEGPFTVFAPTNAAFAKIDSKTLNLY
jgi:uncharacterized surface protein with fasciclin (FAS1) repeats